MIEEYNEQRNVELFREELRNSPDPEVSQYIARVCSDKELQELFKFFPMYRSNARIKEFAKRLDNMSDEDKEK